MTPTLVIANLKLTKDEKAINPSLFKQIIGSLIYFYVMVDLSLVMDWLLGLWKILKYHT